VLGAAETGARSGGRQGRSPRRQRPRGEQLAPRESPLHRPSPNRRGQIPLFPCNLPVWRGSAGEHRVTLL
jgi:hypothetical protein